MPDIYARVSGAWKRCAGLFVRVGGNWKRITNAWVRQGGVWKLVYQYLSRGQQEWSTEGTYSFVVPSGCYAIQACVVGGADNTLSAIRRGAVTLIDCNSTIGSAFGGGNGGAATAGSSDAGGGGAGGYSGDGGAGHPGTGGAYGNGSAGSGGAGGGGCSHSSQSTRQDGAGVYLHGVGAAGAGGVVLGAPPGHGSDLGEGLPRGAGREAVGATPALSGGNLRYTKTNIAVTPGETLTIVVGSRPLTNGTFEMFGGVRTIWGEGRSYPSNAKDV